MKRTTYFLLLVLCAALGWCVGSAVAQGPTYILMRYRAPGAADQIVTMFPHRAPDSRAVWIRQWEGPDGITRTTTRVMVGPGMPDINGLSLRGHYARLYLTLSPGRPEILATMVVSNDAHTDPGVKWGRWSWAVAGSSWHPFGHVPLRLVPISNIEWALPIDRLPDGACRGFNAQINLAGVVEPGIISTGFPFGWDPRVLDIDGTRAPSPPTGPVREDMLPRWLSGQSGRGWDWESWHEPYDPGEAAGWPHFGTFPYPGLQHGTGVKEARAWWEQVRSAEEQRPAHWRLHELSDENLSRIVYHKNLRALPEHASIGRDRAYDQGVIHRRVPDPRGTGEVYDWYYLGWDGQHFVPTASLVACANRDPYMLDMARDEGYLAAATLSPPGDWWDRSLRFYGRAMSSWIRAAYALDGVPGYQADADRLWRLADEWYRAADPIWAREHYGDRTVLAYNESIRIQGDSPVIDGWWHGIAARATVPACLRLPTAEGRAAARRILSAHLRAFIGACTGNGMQMQMARFVLASDPRVHNPRYVSNVLDQFGNWNLYAARVRPEWFTPAERARLDEIEAAITMQSAARNGAGWLDRMYSGSGQWSAGRVVVPVR